MKNNDNLQETITNKIIEISNELDPEIKSYIQNILIKHLDEIKDCILKTSLNKQTTNNSPQFLYPDNRESDNLELLRILTILVKKYPALRFGQLLYTTGILVQNEDCFYDEPSKMIKKLKDFCKNRDIIIN